jgi:hypothetical protein
VIQTGLLRQSPLRFVFYTQRLLHKQYINDIIEFKFDT